MSNHEAAHDEECIYCQEVVGQPENVQKQAAMSDHHRQRCDTSQSVESVEAVGVIVRLHV